MASATLVVARYREKLGWLSRVPDSYDVIVRNKGGDTECVPWNVGRIVDIDHLANIGRESHTISDFIAERYNTLPEWLVFAQGDPFDHSPFFIDLLEAGAPTWTRPYHPLSLRYTASPPMPIPPERIVSSTGFRGPGWRTERLWTHTLDSVYFRDKGTVSFSRAYKFIHKLSENENVMHHFFGRAGLPGHFPRHARQSNFAYGAIFAVRRDAILQHPRRVYESIRDISVEHPSHGYVIERAWMPLFDIRAALADPPLQRT